MRRLHDVNEACKRYTASATGPFPVVDARILHPWLPRTVGVFRKPFVLSGSLQTEATTGLEAEYRH